MTSQNRRLRTLTQVALVTLRHHDPFDRHVVIAGRTEFRDMFLVLLFHIVINCSPCFVRNQLTSSKFEVVWRFHHFKGI